MRKKRKTCSGEERFALGLLLSKHADLLQDKTLKEIAKFAVEHDIDAADTLLRKYTKLAGIRVKGQKTGRARHGTSARIVATALRDLLIELGDTTTKSKHLEAVKAVCNGKVREFLMEGSEGSDE